MLTFKDMKDGSYDRNVAAFRLRTADIPQELPDWATLDETTKNSWRHQYIKHTHDNDDDDTSIEQILKERGQRYGDFTFHAVIAQQLKQAMWNAPRWVLISLDKRQALEIIADKIARILNGDPEYLDSWQDIIGYTQLVIDRLQKRPLE